MDYLARTPRRLPIYQQEHFRETCLQDPVSTIVISALARRDHPTLSRHRPKKTQGNELEPAAVHKGVPDQKAPCSERHFRGQHLWQSRTRGCLAAFEKKRLRRRITVISIISRIEKRNIGGLLWTAFYRRSRTGPSRIGRTSWGPIICQLVASLGLFRAGTCRMGGMFQFTTKQLMGLMVIAAPASVIATYFAPADPYSVLLATAFLFVFGGSRYVAGLRLANESKPPKDSV